MQRVCQGIQKILVELATKSAVVTCNYTPGKGKIVPRNYTPGRGKIAPRNITLLVGEKLCRVM